MVLNKSVVFLKYPTEFPVPGEHFTLETNNNFNPTLNNNDILLHNKFFSLDPYMRGRMTDRESYIPPFEIGKTMEGYGVAEVIESKNPSFPVGSWVSGFTGWEIYTLVPAAKTSLLNLLPKNAETSKKIPLSAYVGVLGMPGFTAYSSLKIIGQPKVNETIYISAASGAVGQLVGQMARMYSLRVVGSAGTDEKVAYLLNDLKFDAAFNYHKGGPIIDHLRRAAPEGIDIYFDNVGGETLDAALECMRLHGRIIVCGMISQYNTTKPYGVTGLVNVLIKRLVMRGFINTDFLGDCLDEFMVDVTRWIENDEIIYREDEVDGIEKSLDAFVGMLNGRNFGKQVVKLC
ncbi:hypothetical protein FBU30_000643 [Linnemannia zychae]|nr:hypothetical protein FBU30_000643 [Linnemannia zychae]